MASSVSYEGPYYTGNNSISFRSLQTNFGGNSNNVKFSTYYRNTNVDESNPIVPDATENATIPTSSTIEASDFRNSIKKYYVTQLVVNQTMTLMHRPGTVILQRIY